MFQIKVSLLDVAPRIWRRLLVPQDVSMPRLHRILQLAMGWTDSHLHQFRVGELRFAEPDDEQLEPRPIDYRRIALNQLAPQRGSTCVYEYDFGDGWEHLIEVEEELPVETVSGAVPRCLAGERACPPEDCGGPGGYAEVLVALSDAGHPEHDQWCEWAGPAFDPAAFDMETINRALRRFRR
ncbi:MAG: plasmid pRiA4b ORF-3 family protein [Candidatus Dormibacteraeota bacterium]|nr:plasmid pRiA4b ORF-3 family protein [Candidatus Dormibacteraeota bacterium]